MTLRAIRAAAVSAIMLGVPATCLKGQLAVSSDFQGAVYPQDSVVGRARQADFRGWGRIEYSRTLSQNLDFRGDLIVYGLHNGHAFTDGTAELVWKFRRIEVAGGLLRERWGRFTNSSLDMLSPANTVFSLFRPELRLSQPAIRTTAFFGAVTLDFYVLAGGRLQPLPDVDRRFSLGVPSSAIVQRGTLGDQAIAFRLSGTRRKVDWSTHAYVGRSRQPTFVPQFTRVGELAGVDAVYTPIRQFGGELETTVADWRFLTEGFARQGAVDVTGRKQTYGHVAAAAEYQRFGVFGRTYDIIPRFEFTADTRGDRADLPFASSFRVGTRIVQTRMLPVQIEPAYAYDWSSRGHGVIASIEKPVAESPMLRLGFRFTKFTSSVKPGLLNLWKHDVELSVYLRMEISHR